MTTTRRVEYMGNYGYHTGRTVMGPEGPTGPALMEIAFVSHDSAKGAVVEQVLWLPETDLGEVGFEPSISTGPDGHHSPEDSALALVSWIRSLGDGESVYVSVKAVDEKTTYGVKVSLRDGEMTADLEGIDKGGHPLNKDLYPKPGWIGRAAEAEEVAS